MHTDFSTFPAGRGSIWFLSLCAKSSVFIWMLVQQSRAVAEAFPAISWATLTLLLQHEPKRAAPTAPWHCSRACQHTVSPALTLAFHCSHGPLTPVKRVESVKQQVKLHEEPFKSQFRAVALSQMQFFSGFSPIRINSRDSGFGSDTQQSTYQARPRSLSGLKLLLLALRVRLTKLLLPTAGKLSEIIFLIKMLLCINLEMKCPT